jgi:hypothetical protein
VQTRSLLKSVQEHQSESKKSKIESFLLGMFWSMLFQLTPYADHDKSLQQDLVTQQTNLLFGRTGPPSPHRATG